MNEQTPQPQELLSTPSVGTETSKPETARNRYLIAAVLILLAIGLGSWVWHDQVPKLFPTPTPTTDQQLTNSSTPALNNQDQEKELLAKAINSATINIGLPSDTEIRYVLSEITLKDGEYEYDSNACPMSPCTIRLGKVEYYDIDSDSDLDVFAQSWHWTGGMKEDTAVQVFLNTNRTLSHIGSIDTGQQLGYNWLKFDNGKIEVNYNTQYNGAAGYSDPKTFVYKVEDGKIIEIVNSENK